jgi:hypothetical protein
VTWLLNLITALFAKWLKGREDSAARVGSSEAAAIINRESADVEKRRAQANAVHRDRSSVIDSLRRGEG